ncbi:MAG: peptidylprolyl isomerase, partial [Clostridiales bacterium]|nr:peptidylprolyl isomerase [Clostridiales bacterium]
MEASRPLAVVGTTAITQADVTEALIAMGPAGQQYNNPQGMAVILDQLIEQALFLTDARKNMLEYDPLFKQQLAKVKDDLLVQFAISRAIEKATVTDAEIKKFYDENPDQFAGQETVTASHILVDSEEQANAIRKEIEEGMISFEDAARKYSSCPSAPQGGSLGEFGRGQMVPEFDQAVFAMEPGAISEPVKTQFG